MNEIFQHNVKITPWPIEDNSVDCIVTSPPYWALRDYGHSEQIGQEETPEDFVKSIVDVFNEGSRVLKPEGTLWLNLGDSYASAAKNRTEVQASLNSGLMGGLGTQLINLKQKSKIVGDLKPKDLVGIPWMVAFALRSAGWYLRQDIIWSKPNPMPESVTDRCTKSHEYLFMLSKSSKYYYDSESIRQKPAISSIKRLSQDIDNQKGSERVPGKTNGSMKAVSRVDKQRGHSRRHVGFNDRWDSMSKEEQAEHGANKRSVWNIPTQPFSEAHFATFPPDLIVDCIKAGCPEGGVVLDPFMGAGTTAMVAKKLNRNFIGLELNADYIQVANGRLRKEIGMFL